ncbi:hypothetical protein [Streptomyces flaveolus]|uniref:hypothetical protein n=1 Tax=Streptomyces flaveolus TaxID=67297 RepID=UPI0034005012
MTDPTTDPLAAVIAAAITEQCDMATETTVVAPVQLVADVAAAAARTALHEPDETAAAECAECSHSETDHGEGDDPVSPGQCSSCPDDDSWHDYQPADGAQPRQTATSAPRLLRRHR